MSSRLALPKIIEHLTWSPAVGILGPRRVGKTTLAKAVATDPATSIYLDLDNPQAMARLGNPAAFFAANRHRLVVLDQIQNQPQILSELRGEIDEERRPGRFLLLRSAPFKLLKHSQSLAGRKLPARCRCCVEVTAGDGLVGFVDNAGLRWYCRQR